MKLKEAMDKYGEYEVKEDELKKVKINKRDLFDSKSLNQIFHHPSPDLDGKDKIEYVINNLRKNCPMYLRKDIAENVSCMKAGKICGKYAALNDILNKEDVEKINSLLRKRREIYISCIG